MHTYTNTPGPCNRGNFPASSDPAHVHPLRLCSVCAASLFFSLYDFAAYVLALGSRLHTSSRSRIVSAHRTSCPPCHACGPHCSIGLDTCLAIQQTIYHGTGDSKYRPSVLLERMVDAQWYGKKSGKGFYDYSKE